MGCNSSKPEPDSPGKKFRHENQITRRKTSAGFAIPGGAGIVKQFQKQPSYWEKNEGGLLEEPLKHVRLIKVSALIRLGDLHASQRAADEPLTPMPRCQDWDPKDYADPKELRGWSKQHMYDNKGDHHEVSGLPIIVLSICWFDREHPDKYGEQLEMLLGIWIAADLS